MKTDRPWQGEVLGNDPRYSSFESPEAGIRAMARTLTTYGEKHGLKTARNRTPTSRSRAASRQPATPRANRLRCRRRPSCATRRGRPDTP